MRTARLLKSLGIVATTGFVAITPACGEKKSAIMLAITTDMKAPKDVNAVSVTVSTNNTIRHNVVGRVTPQGDILLPATLAIVQPDEPNASIRIRVMAFQERKARVMRDVRTSIPVGGRVALLRIPLNFVNDKSAQGELPVGALPAPNPGSVTSTPGVDGGVDGGAASTEGPGAVTSADSFDPFLFVPNCPNPEHTWIDGECQDAYIDANALPEFDEALVGAGDVPGRCFDMKACFGSAIPLQAPVSGGVGGVGGTGGGDGAGPIAPPPPQDAGAPPDGRNLKPQNIGFNVDTCTVQLDASVDPSKLNIALVTRDTGECLRPNECYVPLDAGERGWKVDGNQIKLPSFVCKLVRGQNLRLAYSSGCGSKHEENPLCAETAITTPPVTVRPDASMPSSAQLLVDEAFPTSIGFDGNNYYLAGSSRIAQVPMSGNGQGQPVNIASQKLPWSFGDSAGQGFVLTNGTNTVYVNSSFDGAASTQAMAITLPVGAVAYNAAIVPAMGKILIAAGPQGNLGGIYAASFGQTTAQKITANFGNATQLDEATVVGATNTGFLFGNSKGQVASCGGRGSEIVCGVLNDLGHGERANAATRKPSDGVAYGLFQTNVYRAQFVASGSGQIVGFSLADANVSSLAIEGKNYTRAIAATNQCVFFTNAEGLSFALDTGDQTKRFSRVIYRQTAADKPVLGVAVGPRPGSGPTAGAPSVFFTVFAPLGQGGGMYVMDVPEECRGASPVDPTIDDGGVILPPADAGGGAPPADASALDATTCARAGQACSDASQCCAGATCVFDGINFVCK